MDYKRLGEAVRAARDARGWRQEDLADQAHVGLSSIQNVEAGRRFSRIPTSLRKIDAALGWETGSCVAILNGGEPTPRRENAGETPGLAKAAPSDALASTGADLPPALKLMLEDGDVIDYTLVALPGETDLSVAMVLVHPSTYQTEESRAELRRRVAEFRQIAARVSKLDPELSTLDTPPDAHE